LRLWQYFANASLWIDEIALAENVLRRPLAVLLRQPLALDQVAPPGFLALAKASVALFGPSEMALRLPPLLGGLAALLLFPALSRRFQPAWIAVFATALFAVLPTLIGHSAEFKPYSIDVFAAVALTVVALGLLDPGATAGRFLRAAVLGAAAVWFSQGAVFVVAGLGAALLLLALQDRTGARGLTARLAGVIALWAVSAGAAAADGLHRVPPAMREYLNHFWHPSLPSVPVAAFVVIAVAALWKRDRQAALLLAGPVVVALLAAAMHLYPFSGRAILFLAPAAVLGIAECAGWLVEGLKCIRVPRRVAGAIPALALLAVIAHDPPVYRDEDTRPVLQGLASRWQPGDAIYVYYAAERAFRFYGPRVGLSPGDAAFGGCHRGDPRSYLRELDHFRGRPRVWVFRTHVSGALAEGPTLDGYLARMGTRTDTVRADEAEAVLWDLSSAGALPADAAETHPLPAWDEAAVSRLQCGHGPIGATPDDWN
jgi:hypothetical protein